MKIYTRRGDAGQTSLRWGERIAKDAPRVEAYGTVDEANALLGMALATLPRENAEPLRSILTRIQRELFDLGADLACPPNRQQGEQLRIREEMVEALEQDIDALDANLPPLKRFILPGGSPAAAALHAARTVVRRAERRVVTLAAAEEVDGVLLKYLNRLSDLLFVAAREANRLAGVPDVEVVWPQG
ncbi:MAG TPA: cob(I)yrinic acid a,c-diamide adenosyltransferase [Symbiobacteriaceae bacterium]